MCNEWYQLTFSFFPFLMLSNKFWGIPDAFVASCDGMVASGGGGGGVGKGGVCTGRGGVSGGVAGVQLSTTTVGVFIDFIGFALLDRLE